ncbi:MAG: hypothetical protein ABEI96_06530 [Haloarculaceae archaeon]
MAILDDVPLASGAVGGAVAYLLGYLATYALTIRAIERSLLGRLADAVSGDPAGWKIVGWVFYNAHGVGTRLTLDVPLLGTQHSLANFVADGTFSPVLYLVPVVALGAAGGAVAYRERVETGRETVLSGASVLFGYLPLSVVGAVAFAIVADGATGRPALAPAVGLAGVVYPLVIGVVGAVLGRLVADSTTVE